MVTYPLLEGDAGVLRRGRHGITSTWPVAMQKAAVSKMAKAINNNNNNTIADSGSVLDIGNLI